jgi:hypothetical protein
MGMGIEDRGQDLGSRSKIEIGIEDQVEIEIRGRELGSRSRID